MYGVNVLAMETMLDTSRRDDPGCRAVLVVDDELFVARALSHLLVKAGYDVTVVTDVREAVRTLASRSFDVILSDINMPGLSGLELLPMIRAHDLDVPVILMTGAPTLESAIRAVSLGALHYLTKPVDNAHLIQLVFRASMLHRLARVRRDAAHALGGNAAEAGDLAGLEAAFGRALSALRMAFQPVVESGAGRNRTFGYEALLRSDEPALPDPGAVVAAAERLDRLPDLGRVVRERSALAFQRAPADTLLFVNLHPCDLLDPELYDMHAPLSLVASRVVLEITERAALDRVPGVAANVRRLRALGFRIAIDDLGAGYAGLSSFVALEPEFVKLDMSLVRDVNRSAIKRRLIGSIATLCRDLGIRMLAEGIETAAERDVLRELGCELFQGFFFARPGPPFPTVPCEMLADRD